MKFAVLTVAALLATASAATLSDEQYQFLFTKFTQQFNKNYEVSQVFSKFNTFKANLDIIVAHNAQGLSWTMGVNQFTDLTKEEFSKFMGLNVLEDTTGVAPAPSCPGMRAEADISWIDKINPVKNQASCGSCWAFATNGGLEYRLAAATGSKILDISEQELVDCAGAYGNQGCNGGLMSNAYQYIKSRGSVCLTESYPYTARDGSCQAGSCKSTVKVPMSGSGYKSVGKTDDAHIAELKNGPVPVALAASSSAFQMYSSGVVKSCTDRGINHGVTMVAYTNDSDGEYYTIRNSWGASWGDKGHIKLQARTNQCGLTTSSFDAVPDLQ